MQALIDACKNNNFPANIALVISNKQDAEGLAYARQNGIATQIIEHTAYTDRTSFEQALDTALHKSGVEIICLAGFMRLLSAPFVNTWKGRLINIHPSLLPDFKGLNTHARALEAGVDTHGCTVHFVSAEMDGGAIIGQSLIPVHTSDNETTLAKRVLQAEHALYPQCLEALASGSIRLVNGEVNRTIPPA